MRIRVRGRRSENRPVQKALKRRSGNGSRARIGNFTLDGGTVADSAEAPGSLGAYRFRLRTGTVAATLADVAVPATQNPAPHSNLFKEGEGTTLGRHLYLGEGSVFHATLGAASDRTPALVATNAAARIVLDGATLDFSLADGGAVSLYNGVTLVDNRGTLPVEGAFAGLPEGEPVKLPSGRAIYVTYCGGDGNDVVLASCHNETVILFH